ncbi:cation diffusion facilitator family transporter [Dyadobacter fanqingshengii]|uniref:Cation diffusion facilitator family transporter n=1 Tax=Dyadobacter fanqingshengii TaxID=2906443 RepID=A0A9X1PBB3_9BACT|nr:cation diffusion facilitator family transporter [Dyadobacter fanqingshengii]MCF0040753.1 cation diffusion facilitator family transporter [Dyadobacter fanqingshengii]USJ37511.1 cation diffusion facilitator family transporter [Dyadobacter fanqingshengii]
MQINQNKLKQRLILLSFIASILLTGLKFFAYYLTSSNAILSDALESIINVIASGFAFYSIYLSAQPKDRNHPYGHGKIEFFSAGFEGALIMIASLFIIIEAINRIMDPAPIQNLLEGSGFILFTILVNTAIGYKLLVEGKRVNSLALVADGRHLMTDSISSLVLIFSVGLILLTGYVWIDSVASLLFGVFLAYNGFLLVSKSVAGLMDAVDDALLEKVVQTLKSNKKTEWIDVHNLRVQQYGSDLHIDCHLTLPYYWELQKVHETIHNFENILKDSHTGETEIFVHADPCLYQCCYFCRVADCPVRQHAFIKDIDWDAASLVKNEKLYNEARIHIP